jgi:23S rRNA pseudouridine1911/1915/1917 synthase
MSRQAARRALRAGLVKLNGVQVIDFKAVVPSEGVLAEVDLRQGLRTAWVRARHGVAPAATELGLLHLDGDLCVVNKPAGVNSVPPPDAVRPSGHVGDLLRKQLKRMQREAAYIGVVHRLDRDTSGCLVVALTREAHRILGAQFAGEAAMRTYRCVVAGQPQRDADEIHGRQGRGADGRRAMVGDEAPGVEAVTRYRVVRRFARGAELEVELGTGRTHQVRVALASIGCPVLGDPVYAKGHPAARAPRLMLHAWALEIDHPRTGARLRIECPPPEGYAAVVAGMDEGAPAVRPR